MSSKAKPFVSADPTNIDSDFLFQGEYAGLILPDDGRSLELYHRVGVQVVALGNEEFDAVVLEFGLHGAGWDKAERKLLHGKRDNSVLRLYGDVLMAEVKNNHLVLKSERGYVLGQFPRTIRESPTLGQAPPPGAIVLFDGTNTDEFRNGKRTD